MKKLVGCCLLILMLASPAIAKITEVEGMNTMWTVQVKVIQIDNQKFAVFNIGDGTLQVRELESSSSRPKRNYTNSGNSCSICHN